MSDGHRRRVRWLGFAACACVTAVAAWGCIGDYPVTNEFPDQPDLCSDSAALEAALAACAKENAAVEHSCGGVASLTGVVEGTDVRIADRSLKSTVFAVESRESYCARRGITPCTVTDVTAAQVTEPARAIALTTIGLSPYFEFTIQMKDVFAALDGADNGRTIAAGERFPSEATDFTAYPASISLRFGNGRESRDIQGQSVVSTLTILDSAPDRVDADVKMTFVEGAGHLHGCLRLVSTKTVYN